MLIISRHARRQLKWRQITEDDIKAVIDTPDDQTPSVKGRINFWRKFDHEWLKVTVTFNEGNIIVITAVKKREASHEIRI